MLATVLSLSACSGPPGEFAERVKLPSCGELQLEVPFGMSRLPSKAVTCMEQANSAPRGGELVVTYPTLEGDPISMYFRLEPGDDALQVWEDTSEDKFGGDTDWTRYSCLDVADISKWYEGECTFERF